MKEIKNIHLIAISGTAMASLACMLKEQGYNVTGSDQNVYPPMSTQLEKNGIKIISGYSEKNIRDDFDLVIIGNTIKKDNVEAEEAIRKNIPYTSFSNALKELFLQDKKTIVITGTHGKTTTTSLVSWILEVAKLNQSYFVGGIPINFGKSYKINNGKYFVIEGDEYDTAYFDKVPKFLHYKPEYGIITSIEFDHADIFKDLETIKTQFKKFVELIPSHGYLTTCVECENIKEIAKFAKCNHETYGFKNADITGEQIKIENEKMFFRIFHNGKKIIETYANIVGNHNLLNILAVVGIANRLEIGHDIIASALNTFKGVKRRQEVIGVVNDIIVIDDFAHHPTAILETARGIKEKYQNKRLILIFEPRTNTTRRNVFEKELGESLAEGDEIIIAKVFKPEVIPEAERLNVQNVVKIIQDKNKKVNYIEDTSQIVKHIKKIARPNDVICIMSNGGFDNIYQKILSVL
jgi:UDP-N-acetylmuramate: L-alanyl-gamma-D-glutamyl-meso-diaminopimelate ligase